MKPFYLIASVLCMTFFIHQVKGQAYVDIYTTNRDFINQVPDSSLDVLVEKRSNAQIAMVGGNDFKVSATDKKLNADLKKKYWGIKVNDSLFVNCFPLDLGLWYAYAIEIDGLLFIKAAVTLDKERQREMAMSSAVFGTAGGAISGGQLALMCVYYVMNPSTNELVYLSSTAMLALISDFEDLTARYQAESQPEDLEILEKYLAEYQKLMEE